jgi:glycogen operon protein
VELLLFDDVAAPQPARVIELDPRTHRTYHYWHVFVPGIGAGQIYAYRASGPFDPAHGLRFDPVKVLLDPYGRAVVVPEAYSRQLASRRGENHATAMKSVAVDTSQYDWEGDAPLQRPFATTLIYEMHVAGFTRHPNSGVAEKLRGTYEGMIEKIPYLQDLGITAVELLPVFQFDRQDCPPGLVNYWGYSPVSFFAPHASYSSRKDPLGPVDEFRDLVKALHRAGIEVILDVVYNHTAEGNHLGPMLSFKGVDNMAYYRLVPDDLHHYMDFTGTGNSLNPLHPSVLRLIMDSLRYWAIECHVDGFRFDLASALAREFFDVDRLSSFFDVIHQDPVLSQVKLIAEPWDVGPGGYQVGNFPVLWSEWNGIYRDTMRDFWRGEGSCGDFASRLSGSSDLYQSDGRDPFASINFITAHDGFTLADLVSYNEKHNEANGEDNRDGTDDNRSWNCGVEGPTDDGGVIELRKRQQRNFLTTLLLSQGTPMLLGGDELCRTQNGNNNAWCQDNETSWYDWVRTDESQQMRSFTKRLIALRRAHPVFRREGFLEGAVDGEALPDAWWFRSDGHKMTQRDWGGGNCALGLFLNGETIPNLGLHGEEIKDDSFVLLFNSSGDDRQFMLPRRQMGEGWKLEINTADATAEPGSAHYAAHTPVTVTAHSLLVLKRAA